MAPIVAGVSRLEEKFRNHACNAACLKCEASCPCQVLPPQLLRAGEAVQKAYRGLKKNLWVQQLVNCPGLVEYVNTES